MFFSISLSFLYNSIDPRNFNHVNNRPSLLKPVFNGKVKKSESNSQFRMLLNKFRPLLAFISLLGYHFNKSLDKIEK